MKTNWYILSEGRQTELVRYMGSGKWKYESIDDLSLTVCKETFSTRRLIEWILDRDSDDVNYMAQEVEMTSEKEGPHDSQTLGPRALRLLNISFEVGAKLCHRRLRCLNEGTWPPIPRITEITGVARRAAWRGVSHSVYTARTSQGDAYVYPPQRDGVARLVLKDSAPSEQGWLVRLSTKCLREARKYEAELQVVRRNLKKLLTKLKGN